MSLRKQVLTALRKVADPVKAPQMQAYMKSEMPYLGVQSATVKKIVREFIRPVEYSSAKEFEETIYDLWDNAKFREERYVAIQACETKNVREFQQPARLKLYEHMIVDGAWWDYVDAVAIHQVGLLLGDFPDKLKPKMRTWSKSKDLWKRRSAIICQISLKERTDYELLHDCIDPAMDSKEFFLRKGIGWALRDIAWRDPKFVIKYVRKYKDRLSPLSKREALKNVLKDGLIDKIP